MQNKRYKIIKDLPDINKGTIFTWQESLNCYKGEKSIWVSPDRYATYSKGTVEEFPDWFEEIKEVKLEVSIGTKFQQHSNKDFVYTIHSVENETVKVVWDRGNTRYSINQVNTFFEDETWIMYKEKEFEVSYFEEGGKILTAKRLSDGVVFRVGDKVYWNWVNCGNHKYLTISKFELLNDKLRFKVKELEDKDFNFILLTSKLTHYKQPLFLDELGNEVYKGDVYWYITKDWDIYHTAVIKEDPKISTGLRFLNKADGVGYFQQNIPTFSKKQILDSYKQSKLTVSVFGTIINEQVFFTKLGL